MATKFVDEKAKEIRRLYRENGNRIHPAQVVEAAADPESPLHSSFTWDDTEAAAKCRLQEARQLIATVQIVVPDSKGIGIINIRAYHALRTDKHGYRHTRDIMAGPELRAALLSQLADDLDRIRGQYQTLRGVAAAKTLFNVIEEFCGKQREGEAVELAKPTRKTATDVQQVAARRKAK